MRRAVRAEDACEAAGTLTKADVKLTLYERRERTSFSTVGALATTKFIVRVRCLHKSAVIYSTPVKDSAEATPPLILWENETKQSCAGWSASTSRDRALRRAARAMAVECARRWREGNPTLPEDADAEMVAQAVFGGLTAGRLGLRGAAVRGGAG